MDNRWTLHLENFGKIEYADVMVAPLTLFVGDNNSGKSYLMTLLYTLLRMSFHKLDICEDLEEYENCADWLRKAIDNTLEERCAYPFNGETLSLFAALLNQILERNKEDISMQAFGEAVNIGKISISFQQNMEGFLVVKDHNDNNRLSRFIYFANNEEEISSNYDRADSFICDVTDGDFSPDETSHAIAYILEKMIGREYSSEMSTHTDVAFLPISRTGFLLTRAPLVGDAVSRVYTPAAYTLTNRRFSDVRLTKPCSDFLRTVATIDKRNGLEEDSPLISVIHFMETQMIYGTIYVSNDLSMPAFSYHPDQMLEGDFPMFLSSGVVTELAPLLLLLQYTPVRTLFIEEPEMSLHPELQQKMARVLVRLANQKMPVFATTHSNTMIQHINNMIKLHYLPEKTQAEIMARFGFESSDLISEEDISMCQFDVQKNGRTMVSELSGDEYGFLVPTFRDALKNMLDQARATRQEI